MPTESCSWSSEKDNKKNPAFPIHKNEKNTAHQLSVTSIWAPFILHLKDKTEPFLLPNRELCFITSTKKWRTVAHSNVGFCIVISKQAKLNRFPIRIEKSALAYENGKTSQKVVPSPDSTCNDKKADPFTKTLLNKQPFPTGSRSRPYCFLQIAAYSQLMIVHTFRLKKHKNEKNTAHQLSVTSIWAPFILHLQPDNFYPFYRRVSRYLGKNKTEPQTRKLDGALLCAWL